MTVNSVQQESISIDSILPDRFYNITKINNPDTSHQTHYYHRERLKIIMALGCKCSDCEERNPDNLQIHHTNPIRRSNRPSSFRIKDWKIALEAGELQLRCKDHHTHD
jgi:hypothetical protein